MFTAHLFLAFKIILIERCHCVRGAKGNLLKEGR